MKLHRSVLASIVLTLAGVSRSPAQPTVLPQCGCSITEIGSRCGASFMSVFALGDGRIEFQAFDPLGRTRFLILGVSRRSLTLPAAISPGLCTVETTSDFVLPMRVAYPGDRFAVVTLRALTPQVPFEMFAQAAVVDLAGGSVEMSDTFNVRWP